MIIKVLITECEPVDALLDQLLHRIVDAQRVALVGEAGSEATQNVGPALDLAQQQSATVTDHVTAIKAAHDFALAKGLKGEQFLITLCHSESVSSTGLNWF